MKQLMRLLGKTSKQSSQAMVERKIRITYTNDFENTYTNRKGLTKDERKHKRPKRDQYIRQQDGKRIRQPLQ